ncbi:MAG: tetratricopeptide repeat protein [Treponema sp.]|nr:tetratricopeptide repeat protein [Treponema sp.]
MRTDPILNKASILAKKGNYEGALKILKDEEDRYYGSFKYYYLYAVICLYSGSFVEAHSNFNLARKIKMKDPCTMLGLAILYLKRMNINQAVDYYLDVQEIEPTNRIAKKALAVIRKNSESEALSDWLTDNLVKLFPPIPAPVIDTKTIVFGTLTLSAAAILTLVILLNLNAIKTFFKPKELRSTAEFILSDDDKNAPVQIDGSFLYILTHDQAIKLYEEALALFRQFKDEEAKINLNKIIKSNASIPIINRAKVIMDNTQVPSFDTLKDRNIPSLSDVRKEPALYDNVHVIWKGMASNINITNEYTRFDFLVGYDTRRTLEGIITVTFDITNHIQFTINPEHPLEVLGKIKVNPLNSAVSLQGIAIHQSGRLDNF